MKRLIIIGVTASILLMGCGSGNNDGVKESQEKVQAALAEQDYATAYETLRAVYDRGELGPEGIDMLIEIEEEYINQSYNKGLAAFEEKDFNSTVEHLSIVVKYSDDEEIAEVLAQAKYLEKEQENFNVYLITFKEMLDESNILLKRFNRLLDDLATGDISTDLFSKHIQEIIPQSNMIINSLDHHIYDVDPELLALHKEMISLINNQHELFIISLDMKSDNRATLMRELRRDYVAIKQEQANRIVAMKIFAGERSLTMNVDLDETLRDIEADQPVVLPEEDVEEYIEEVAEE
ncbi:hypothetical protein [Alkalihalophilus marmarensis]|uniref:hypothetical protein n=1 Tax=Alkalihalophilus marmarensis TaxID=521377 RepID=UPI002DBAE31D|nr:hypothetical protein [Alkalihalophilus marmarensis]MEC2074450.1 hypothetical protein [Alkalihalophilus marmarensis]